MSENDKRLLAWYKRDYDALKAERDALQQRIAELEAQTAKEAQETVAMEAELNTRIETLEDDKRELQDAFDDSGIGCNHAMSDYDVIAAKAVQKTLDIRTMELAEARALNAALNAALLAASGVGVKMETLLTRGETLYAAQNEINSMQQLGWEFLNLILQHNGHWAIVMQRPARPAESESVE